MGTSPPAKRGISPQRKRETRETGKARQACGQCRLGLPLPGRTLGGWRQGGSKLRQRLRASCRVGGREGQGFETWLQPRADVLVRVRQAFRLRMSEMSVAEPDP